SCASPAATSRCSWGGRPRPAACPASSTGSSATESPPEEIPVELRPITTLDTPALAAFVARIPEGDRTFLEADALDPARVATWAGDQRARRVVAADAAAVAGIVAAVPGGGWTGQVGGLRLVADPARRRTGLGG